MKSAAAEVEAARRYWSLTSVGPKLLSHQRILAVPGTFACDNSTYQTLQEADAVVTAKLKLYVAWAREDERCVDMQCCPCF